MNLNNKFWMCNAALVVALFAVFNMSPCLSWSASRGLMLVDGMDAATATHRLQEGVRLMESIEGWVERPLYPRFYLAKIQMVRTLKTIRDQGLGNTETTNDFQKLVNTLKFSERLFREGLNTPFLKDTIDQLYVIRKEFVVAYRLGDPYTKVLDGILWELKRLIEEAEKSNLSAELVASMRDQVPLIGRALKNTGEGDTTIAYQSVKPVMFAFRKLYANFTQVTAGVQGFNLVIEIQGLVEYCFDFSKDFQGVADLPAVTQAAPVETKNK